MALLRVAGNRWAEQAETDLREVVKLNRHSLFKQWAPADSLADHGALMPTIGCGDAGDAALVMRTHFENCPLASPAVLVGVTSRRTTRRGREARARESVTVAGPYAACANGAGPLMQVLIPQAIFTAGTVDADPY